MSTRMKIVTIIGARPQFIKAATVSRAIADHNQKNSVPFIEEILVHTGQHYDDYMSSIFFRELGIPELKYNLNIGSASHGQQTGKMLMDIEAVLLKEKPDWVLIYGDTNSTLAGALAAAKLHIRIAHVEAGLRSYNRLMPEEINRVVSDQLSTLLFCPSKTAVDNLAAEGITKGVSITGDVMAGALQYAVARASSCSGILADHGLQPQGYFLATVHRAENTDDPVRLSHIMAALSELAEQTPVILPLHPRTRKVLAENAPSFLTPYPSFKLINPVGYLDFIALERSARFLITDSGGIQKEAYWLKVPCITMREETEWVETVESGWNVLTGAYRDRIVEAVRTFNTPLEHPALYGDDKSAGSCLNALLECFDVAS